MASLAIDDSIWAERARLRCPRGHNSWEAYDTTWYGRSCRESYDEFVDTKTRETVSRGDVILKDGFRQR